MKPEQIVGCIVRAFPYSQYIRWVEISESRVMFVWNAVQLQVTGIDTLRVEEVNGILLVRSAVAQLAGSLIQLQLRISEIEAAQEPVSVEAGGHA